MKYGKRILAAALALCLAVCGAGFGLPKYLARAEAATGEEVYFEQAPCEDLEQETKLAQGQPYRTPMMTVLTPGLGAGSANWSNQLDNENESGRTSEFCYDSSSIIEQLRSKTGQEHALVVNAVFDEEYVPQEAGGGQSGEHFRFTLTRLDLPENNKNWEFYRETQLRNLTAADLAEGVHIIVVFEPSKFGKLASHAQAYTELNYVVDSLSLNLKRLTGEIPKVNFIGHSRGGILNLMYATEHPYNAGELFSVGTPYQGSTMGEIGYKIYDEYPKLFEKSQLLRDIMSMMLSDGGKDCCTPEMYQKLRSDWAEKVESKGIDIPVHAIGGVTDLAYFADMIPGESGGKDFLRDLVDGLVSCPVTLITGGALLLVPGVRELIIVPIALASGFATWDQYLAVLALLNNMVARFFLPSITVDIDESGTESILLDDFFVQYYSQTGQRGSGELTPYSFYTYQKVFKRENTDLLKLSGPNAFPAGHLLESRDEEIVACIASRIPMGVCQQFNTGYAGNGTAIKSVNYVSEEVVIPDALNGTPVTEIADHAFSGGLTSQGGANGNSAVRSVKLPAGLVKIGAGAFEGFSGLTELALPDTLQFIGEGAFSGSGIARFSVSSANPYFSERDGNLYDKSGKKLLQYAPGKTDTLYTVEEGVTEIGSAAFYGCENLQAAELPASLKKVGTAAFYGCKNLYALQGGENVEFSGLNAFSGTAWRADAGNRTGDFLTLGKTLIAYLGDGTEVTAELPGIKTIGGGAFYNSSVIKAVLPQGIEHVGDYAFYGCEKLAEITLPASVISIGDSAFRFCAGLKTLTVLAPVVPLTGDYALYNTANDMEILVPKLSLNAYQENSAWVRRAELMTGLKMTIRFEKEGGTIMGDEMQSAEYYSVLESLPKAVRTGYLFAGWFEEKKGGGAQYEAGSLWEKAQDTALYAHWVPELYAVRYHADGGTVSAGNPASYTIESDFTPEAPHRDNYLFCGWFADRAYTERVERVLQRSGTLDLFAKWEGVRHTLTYEIGGASKRQDVFFGSSYLLPVPQEPGRFFDGWFDSAGSRYTDCSGNSLKEDIVKDTVLTARFEYSFKIKVTADGKMVWLGSEGVKEEETSITAGRTEACPHCLAAEFAKSDYAKKTGYYFSCFTKLYGDAASAVTCWLNREIPYADGETVDLFAYFAPEKYEIIFEMPAGFAQLNTKTLLYGERASLPAAEKLGYTFGGWEIIRYSGQGGLSAFSQQGYFFKTVYTGDVDLSPGSGESSVYVTVRPVLSANSYRVTTELWDGRPGREEEVVFGKPFMFAAPDPRTGYLFFGWYSERNGMGTRYTDQTGISLKNWDIAGNAILYGYWVAEQYSIRYETDGGTLGGYIQTTYTVKSISFPLATCTKFGYRFAYWQEESGERLILLPMGSTGNKVYTAHWYGEAVVPTAVTTNHSGILNFNSVNTAAKSEQNNGVILYDLRNMQNRLVFFSLDASIDKVTFWGGSGYNRVVILTQNETTRQKDLDLVFRDVKFTGTELPCIWVSDYPGTTTMSFYGECELGRGQTENRTIAVYSGVSLYAYGKLTVYGADGKNGSAGNSALSGARGTDGVPNGMRNGSAGGSGGDGENGGKGGDGGYAMEFASAFKVKIYNGQNIFLYGGNGGNGGRGGDGGNGGRGGDGAAGRFLSFAGDGGRGGDGGAGGRGGDGGAGSPACNVTLSSSVTAVRGTNGFGGGGGNGGSGGDGGNAGLKTNGKYAVKGSGGTGGAGGEGLYNGKYGFGGGSGIGN